MATARTRPHHHPVHSTVQAHGCEADLEIRQGYPHVHNDVHLAAGFKQAAIAYLGAERVHDLDIRMTGEDFSYFANEVPGCFYRLGTASPEEGNDHGTQGFTPPPSMWMKMHWKSGRVSWPIAATVER